MSDHSDAVETLVESFERRLRQQLDERQSNQFDYDYERLLESYRKEAGVIERTSAVQEGKLVDLVDDVADDVFGGDDDE